MPTPDTDLLVAFVRDRDEAAFRVLAERYLGLVFHAALRRTGDRSLAEEISQNVLCALATKAGRLAKHPDRLPAWLHRATLYESTKAMRSQASRRRREQLADLHAASTPDSDAMWVEALPHLDLALDSLGDSDRRLLLLHFYEGRSYPRIAELLGKSTGAVQKQSQRALEKLAELLRGKGVPLSVVALAGGLGIEFAKAAPASVLHSSTTAAMQAASGIAGGPSLLMAMPLKAFIPAALIIVVLPVTLYVAAVDTPAEATKEGHIVTPSSRSAKASGERERGEAMAASKAGRPVSLKTGSASPGLVALRKAVADRDGFAIHSNIQHFESGEFEEVWGLLLQCRDSDFLTQEMQLAVARGVNVGKLDEVLALVTRDIPPGIRRNSLLEWMFSGGAGAGENLAANIAKVEALSEPAEKAAAYQGLGARFKNLKSLALIDPADFVNSPPDLLKALARGVGDYPSASSSVTGEVEWGAKVQESLAFADEMIASGHVGGEFLSGVIASMARNRVDTLWDILQETRPGLIQSDAEICRSLLNAMSNQEPEKSLNLAAQESWVEAGAMRKATTNWLYRDSAEAQAWYDSHVGSLTPGKQARMAAGFADFHLQRKEPELARKWIERIGDPDFRQSVIADHERMRGWEVQVTVEVKP